MATLSPLGLRIEKEGIKQGALNKFALWISSQIPRVLWMLHGVKHPMPETGQIVRLVRYRVGKTYLETQC